MTNAFDRVNTIEVQVQDPVVGVMDDPPVVSVSIDPNTAPNSRPPRQDARFPDNVLKVNPTLLPIENTIVVFPYLFGDFVVT